MSKIPMTEREAFRANVPFEGAAEQRTFPSAAPRADDEKSGRPKAAAPDEGVRDGKRVLRLVQ